MKNDMTDPRSVAENCGEWAESFRSSAHPHAVALTLSAAKTQLNALADLNAELVTALECCVNQLENVSVIPRVDYLSLKTTRDVALSALAKAKALT